MSGNCSRISVRGDIICRSHHRETASSLCHLLGPILISIIASEVAGDINMHAKDDWYDARGQEDA